MRQRRLPLVANNTRFLILSGVLIPNLASAVLAPNTRRLTADWRRVHGHPLWLAETFVDPSAFAALPIALPAGYPWGGPAGSAVAAATTSIMVNPRSCGCGRWCQTRGPG